MQARPLRHTAGSQAVPARGAGTEPATDGYAAGRTAIRSPLGKPAQLAATAGMLTGLWAAISPWFLTLHAPRGGNATANDLIIGLASAGRWSRAQPAAQRGAQLRAGHAIHADREDDAPQPRPVGQPRPAQHVPPHPEGEQQRDQPGAERPQDHRQPGDHGMHRGLQRARRQPQDLRAGQHADRGRAHEHPVRGVGSAGRTGRASSPVHTMVAMTR